MTTEIVEYSKTEAALAELAEKYKGVIFDVTTKEGMATARKGRAELRGYRTALEKTRVEIKAPALKRCQLIDTEARRITAALLALEEPIDQQITKEEDRKVAEQMAALRAEEERKAAEERARKEAEEAVLAAQRAEIARQRAELQAAEEARLKADLAARLKIEEEQRAARMRIEEEERKARMAREEADRQARLVREAEEAKLKAERERIESERRAAEDAARRLREAEEAKALAERRAKEEAERKEREAEEAKQREIRRKEAERLDARQMLETFVKRYGHLEEYADVVQAIRHAKYLQKLAA